MTTKTYYHVIEENHDLIGWQGVYTTLAEAEAEVTRLQNFFPNLFFYVHADASKREPNFITA